MAFTDAKQIEAKLVLELNPLSINPQDLEKLAVSQLEHALDAYRRGLRIYESLKSLNDVIGTQYGDRVLFELVQNAHDAHGSDDNGEIAIHLLIENEARGELIVTNRGRGVTDSNLDAIRNIGTSDKEIGEGIGNKGLGFRSVEALTDDVRIYSSRGVKVTDIFDGYCFRFATPDEMKAMLVKLDATPAIAEIVSKNIPRYLVPLPAPDQSETVRRFAKAGFATVVALPLTSYDTVKLAKEQVFALASQSAMGAAPTDTQRREALLWAFRVWWSGGGKQVDDAVRSAKLYVPTLGGWHPASEALLSGSWSRLGRNLESYLHEGASH
jgi:anti-sigma regulatory factor (Ser/Thr protein kinase)